MPKKHQTTLHILDKYTKNTVVSQTTSEGVAFAQKGNMNKKNMNTMTRSSIKTRGATTTTSQATQHPIDKEIPSIIPIRIRMKKSLEPAGQANTTGRTSHI